MGFLDFLLPPDPARRWAPQSVPDPVVDLDVPSFAGLRLGDPSEAIARFGPPENPRPSRDGQYDYLSRGFEIDATAGKIDCFAFCWDDGNPDRHFRGRFFWNGSPLRLDAGTTEAQVRKALGEPYWIDNDVDERLWFYEFLPSGVEWQVEFVRDRLTVLTLVTPAMLAKPEHREAYRVTRPWPPL